MKRRGLFIFVADPDQADVARRYRGEWLRSLDGHPGYLGGSVLTELAGELLPNTLVMLMEYRMLHIHAAEVEQLATAS